MVLCIMPGSGGALQRRRPPLMLSNVGTTLHLVWFVTALVLLGGGPGDIYEDVADGRPTQGRAALSRRRWGFAGAAAHTPDPAQLPNWCTAGPYSLPPGALPYTGMMRRNLSFKIYHNVYWHTQKWYAFLPPSEMDNKTLEEGLSVNTALMRLPVVDVEAFTDNLAMGFLPGTTLLVDFPFPAFPDNNGHWAEILLPTYSVLANASWMEDVHGRSRFVDRILLPNLRKEFNDYFRELLAVSLSPGVRRGGSPIPPIIDHSDLEQFPKLSWLAFQNLLVIQDRYTHPDRRTGFVGTDHGDLWRYDGCARYVDSRWDVGFKLPEHAADFRVKAYERAGLPPPQPWTPGQAPPLPQPLQITLLLHHEDYPPLVNWQEAQAVLARIGAEYGMVARSVSLSTDAPFSSHVDTFSRSAVLVGRHGPLMASAFLMPPGGAVFELLPYKWEWGGISRLYYNMSASAGDVHHFAWRPLDPRLAHYDHKNYTRYIPWTPEECSARECLMVHARAGLSVDLGDLEALLRAKLPAVLAGSPVDSLREPWPPAM